jgi:ABC-type anion transport system duplicated permease subunit
MKAIEPKAALTYLSGLKLTRYGIFGIGCFIAGNWAGQQWPEESAAFWAMPATSLGMALFGLWLSQRKTVANERDTEAKVSQALRSAPPGMTLVAAEPGEVVPK